jgi:hypothetical protein
MSKRCELVSRVGTLIDKRQPLTPKLHVRVNLHGTHARAPYSERRLYIPFLGVSIRVYRACRQPSMYYSRSNRVFQGDRFRTLQAENCRGVMILDMHSLVNTQEIQARERCNWPTSATARIAKALDRGRASVLG